MNIGEVAAETGITSKSIRYYESIGLIPEAHRTGGGYRQYSDKDVQILHFVRRARNLGFTVGEVEELLSLYRDRDRASADVREIAIKHITDLDKKVAELEGMRATLTHLVEKCHGDDRPDCPILDDLARADG
ncbi:MAG: Cu(I)-responsive transcriptional regulator [Proteobacteria bacterium]|nr:Cu(I)-responsive transcriptional regulator [Pseudomonadota bacterium]